LTAKVQHVNMKGASGKKTSKSKQKERREEEEEESDSELEVAVSFRFFVFHVFSFAFASGSHILVCARPCPPSMACFLYCCAFAGQP